MWLAGSLKCLDSSFTVEYTLANFDLSYLWLEAGAPLQFDKNMLHFNVQLSLRSNTYYLLSNLLSLQVAVSD